MDLQNSDEILRRGAYRIMEERRLFGREGLVGGLQAVIINTEPHLQKAAVEEFIRYSGLQFQEAFMDTTHRTSVLKVPGSAQFRSADFLIRSRLKGSNPFREINVAPQTRDLRNTRLETFVFETSDIERYVSLQSRADVKFQSEILDFDNYYFIQTMPSKFTGNSLGFIEWKGERCIYSSPESQRIDWNMEKPSSFASSSHPRNIRWLDHAATRVRAQDRDPAILEFMRLTNYSFDFAIYVKSLNSITSVARLSSSDFAMVFTSGITPFVSQEASGPTEKFISNCCDGGSSETRRNEVPPRFGRLSRGRAEADLQPAI